MVKPRLRFGAVVRVLQLFHPDAARRGVAVWRGRFDGTRAALAAVSQCATACTLALVLVPLSAAFAREAAFYFWMTPQRACRHVYQENPFVEAIAVGNYIRAHTNPGDSIAIIGSEPEIYFYCRRPAATGFIYPALASCGLGSRKTGSSFTGKRSRESTPDRSEVAVLWPRPSSPFQGKWWTLRSLRARQLDPSHGGSP